MKQQNKVTKSTREQTQAITNWSRTLDYTRGLVERSASLPQGRQSAEGLPLVLLLLSLLVLSLFILLLLCLSITFTTLLL